MFFIIISIFLFYIIFLFNPTLGYFFLLIVLTLVFWLIINSYLDKIKFSKLITKTINQIVTISKGNILVEEIINDYFLNIEILQSKLFLSLEISEKYFTALSLFFENSKFTKTFFYENHLWTIHEFLEEKLNSKYYSPTKRAMYILLENESLKFLNLITLKYKFSQYSFVDIYRSSIPILTTGTYLYKFDKAGNIVLMQSPLRKIKSNFIGHNKRSKSVLESFFLYDSANEIKISQIEKNRVVDFNIFGGESIFRETELTSKAEGSHKFILSEALIGTSFTMLKGLKSIDLKTANLLKDVRLVQIILDNNTDIVFLGINIYLDMRRKFFNLYKGNKAPTQNQSELNEIQIEVLKNVTDNFDNKYILELKQLKELLDEGIITQEEYDNRKRIILEF